MEAKLVALQILDKLFEMQMGADNDIKFVHKHPSATNFILTQNNLNYYVDNIFGDSDKHITNVFIDHKLKSFASDFYTAMSEFSLSNTPYGWEIINSDGSRIDKDIIVSYIIRRCKEKYTKTNVLFLLENWTFKKMVQVSEELLKM